MAENDMSLYLLVFLIVLLSSLTEVCSEQPVSHKVLYRICFILMALLLCLRFGQGTDYFSYRYIYGRIPATLDISALKGASDVHTEIGWRYLVAIFKIFGIKFEYFVMMLSLFQMYCLNRCIQHFCTYKIFALLLSFPTLYLTYYISGFRQGLVLAIFLGFMLEWFQKKNYTKYVIGCFLCITIHTVSVVLFLAFIINLNFFRNRKNVLAGVGLCWMIGIAVGVIGFSVVLFSRHFSTHLTFSLTIVERIATFVIVSICYFDASKKIEQTSYLHKFYILYSLGIMLFGLLIAFSATTTSRVAVMFKVIEILLLCSLLPIVERNNKYILLLLLYAIQIVMTLKNLNSYIVQGLYVSSCNMWNYPYVSIFNKDKIYALRYIEDAFFSD